MKLRDSQILVFAHQSQVGGTQYQAPRALARMPFLNTTLDSDDSKDKMKAEFVTFLGGVGVAAMEKSNAEMEASLQAVGS